MGEYNALQFCVSYHESKTTVPSNRANSSLRCRAASRMSLDKCLNQSWIDAGVRPLQPFERQREVNQSTRRGLLEQPQGSDYRESALCGGMPSGAIVHEHDSGTDLKRKTDRFELARVHIERRVERSRRFHGNPGRERAHPRLHRRRCLRMLKLCEDGRRNDHPFEQLG